MSYGGCRGVVRAKDGPFCLCCQLLENVHRAEQGREVLGRTLCLNQCRRAGMQHLTDTQRSRVQAACQRERWSHAELQFVLWRRALWPGMGQQLQGLWGPERDERLLQLMAEVEARPRQPAAAAAELPAAAAREAAQLVLEVLQGAEGADAPPAPQHLEPHFTWLLEAGIAATTEPGSRQAAAALEAVRDAAAAAESSALPGLLLGFLCSVALCSADEHFVSLQEFSAASAMQRAHNTAIVLSREPAAVTARWSRQQARQQAQREAHFRLQQEALQRQREARELVLQRRRLP